MSDDANAISWSKKASCGFGTLAAVAGVGAVVIKTQDVPACKCQLVAAVGLTALSSALAAYLFHKAHKSVKETDERSAVAKNAACGFGALATVAGIGAVVIRTTDVPFSKCKLVGATSAIALSSGLAAHLFHKI